MRKLIYTFKINPTQKTASALLRYIHKHPMAICFADQDDLALIEQAKTMTV